MIVTVCADKGSPGVTTLATVLGLVWPGPRAVVEADTAGSDLSFRLRPAVNGGVLGGRLAPDPSIAVLATAARLGLTDAGPLPYAQDTSLGVPVVPGVLSAERFRALRSLWPQVADGTGGVGGDGDRRRGAAAPTIIRRCRWRGRRRWCCCSPRPPWRGCITCGIGSPNCPARSATRRGPARTWGWWSPGRSGTAASGVEQVRQVLASIGSPAPVIGFVARDPAGAGGLWAGELTRRFAGSELVRSVRATAESVLAGWPELLPRTPTVSPGDGDGGHVGDGDPAHGGVAVAESAGPVMEGTRS